jgi:hypothetical protein
MAVNNFKIDAGAVTSDKIWDGTIIDSDINGTANIALTKISGTAVNVSSNQIITGQKTFDNMVLFGDSTMRVNNTGIRIGDQSLPSAYQLINIARSYDGASSYDGIKIDLRHYGTGSVYGIRSYARDSSGYAFGIRTYSYSNSRRYGLYGSADDMGHDTSQSYGVYGIAYDGVTAYGIYGIASGAVTNWAGYFSGNVNVTGTLSKGGGTFRIDHPLDPENKYLQHSFVESPDMMNVYNGNITLDANGEAVVELPEYFEVLNKDFRYQLTAIGGPAPNLHIAERIYENRFIIAGGEPFMEVSWQVTGVRQDKWAEANRVQVEVDKPDHERGLYIHPEAFGYGREMFINYEQEHGMELEMEESRGE